jgi:hypothetical protein
MAPPVRRLWYPWPILTIRNVTFALLLLLSSHGCSSEAIPVRPVDDATARRLAPFLADDRTTQSDVVKRFGQPSRSFPRDRVWVYQMASRDDRLYIAGGDDTVKYELVLVFNEGNVLIKHTILRLRR